MMPNALTDKEIQLIIESLLYCASTDIDHSHYQEDITEMIQLAIKLRLSYQNITIKNLTFLKDTPFTDPFTQEILKYFPEL